MFGYVVINKPEIKFKDFDTYSAYYCGLCKSLKKQGGFRAQLTLSYDMTFLVIFLSSLYEEAYVTKKYRCIAHPFIKHTAYSNSYTEYTSKMNIILAYYQCLDDWTDEHKYTKKLYSMLLKKKFLKASSQYPKKAEIIKQCLDELHDVEKRMDLSLDAASGCFGRLMSELFVVNTDEWSPTVKSFAFYLGKFIYLMDAYDDVKADIKKGNYNPFSLEYSNADFDDKCQEVLTMMISQACKYFEYLPIIQNIDILRNILYSGVWCRFESIRNGVKPHI